MALKKLKSLAVFGGELIANPGPVGAAVPSSRALARRMASFVPKHPAGCVVELGAGTGVVTAALLERGVPPERLISVERSPSMVKLLRKHFPHLKILAGDAARLGSLLSDCIDTEMDNVSCVVSSLPLRSLPKKTVADIVREVGKVLDHDGQFIQFTYDLRTETNRALADFTRVATSVVWMNIPPARVDVFKRRR